VSQLERDLELSQEVKVILEDTSKKVGKMFLGPALGNVERLGIGHDGASTSQVAPEPVPEFVINPYGSQSNPHRHPVQDNKVHHRCFERGVPRPMYVCTHCKKKGHFREFCLKLDNVSRFATT